MDTQHDDQVHGIDDLERKADELISLILSLCEQEIRGISPMTDARAASLAHAAMTARSAIAAFLALASIR